MPQISMHSPVGDLTISEDDGHIVSVDWGWGRDQDETPVLLQARQQLEEYFDGARPAFDLPLRPAGTAFHRAVWQAMLEIPAGQVRTYGEISTALKASARAVGTACGANPIPVIIPCHRVVGADGLGGYSGDGGGKTKLALLAIEGYETTLPLFESLKRD